MKIAYLDCATGISGDMTLAALIDAGVDEAAVQRAIDSLGLPGVRLIVEPVMKGGFRARSVRVEHPEQHAHRHLSDVHRILDGAEALTDAQQDLARRIFAAVARAEARVHGSTVERVHFHEVGAIDSIVDIVGAAVAFDLLGVERVHCSPLPVGHGRITIDHGVCAVPAPGTAELLKGVPLEDIPVEGELTTPTGAAIVATVVDSFSRLPAMTIESVGYGAGTMDLPDRANLLRVFVGTAAESPETDRVYVLETNLDDVTGEIVGHTKRKLLEAGALDAFTTSIQMKKDRPGVILSVLCRPFDVESLEAILFDETATFGVRRYAVDRSKRTRRQATVETVFGQVAGKVGSSPGGGDVFTPEFEDCARRADEAGVALREVYRAAEAAFTIEHQSSKLAPTPQNDHHHDHDHDHG